MSDLQCPARVYVARHAEAAYDDRLTPAGELEAKELAEGLRGERIARVHTSPMPRAAATARIAAASLGVGVVEHEELAEVGVESEDEVVARVTGVLAEVADLYRGEAVLVVGHSAALGLALGRLLPAPVGLEPGEVVHLEHDADGWVLRPG